MTAQEVIKMLDLKPLPAEGGYYKEIYRAQGVIPGASLPKHKDNRNFATSIYYLITPTEFSRLHKVGSDEIWHFYSGDPAQMVQISQNGQLEKIAVGNGLSNGVVPQVIVPAGTWQGTRLVEGGKWTLMGCTVVPGFEFHDFETLSRDELIALFPEHQETIEHYTHG